MVGSPGYLVNLLSPRLVLEHWPGAFLLVGRYSFLVYVLVTTEVLLIVDELQIHSEKIVGICVSLYRDRVLFACCLQAVCRVPSRVSL